MINPPFPYSVKILREVASTDPFKEDGETTVVYEGICDYDVNRHPSFKNNVQVGKYKLYIPNNTIALELNDTIELQILKRQMSGRIVDFFYTNFGITIYWDSCNN